MARLDDPDSATSQFFINTVDNTFLDKKEDPNGIGYCVFGRVIEGLDVLAKLQRINPEDPSRTPPDKMLKVEVVRKRDHAYEPNKVK